MSAPMPDEKFQQSNSQPPIDKKVAEPSEKGESWQIEALKTVALSLVLAFGIRTFIAEARYIPSGSMEPTLLINDRLIVDKVAYRFNPPQRGDIVVFDPTENLSKKGFKDAFIKRVVGLPGEQVALIDGKVYINGKPLQEKYIEQGLATEISDCDPSHIDTGTFFLSQPQVLAPNQYLVLGDNRHNSLDGRCWGAVPASKIIGKATILFWPLNRISLIPGGDFQGSSPAKK
jgi:signal peptidase I